MGVADILITGHRHRYKDSSCFRTAMPSLQTLLDNHHDVNKTSNEGNVLPGPHFNDMSSFFPCEIDDAIQCINLGYGAQAAKIVILLRIFSLFCVVFKF